MQNVYAAKHVNCRGTQFLQPRGFLLYPAQNRNLRRISRLPVATLQVIQCWQQFFPSTANTTIIHAAYKNAVESYKTVKCYIHR